MGNPESSGQTTSTADPVTVVELADRLGVPANRVYQWSRTGRLPEPDFYPRGAKLWAWESLIEIPFIKEILDALPTTSVE